VCSQTGQEELVLYSDATPSASTKPAGLGAIQQEGRTQVLQAWARVDTNVTLPQTPPSGRQSRPFLELRGQRRRTTTILSDSFRGIDQGGSPSDTGQSRLSLHALSGVPSDSSDMEWSTLSEASKQALSQWAAGQLGGQHCMLMVEHGEAAEADLDPASHCKHSTSNVHGGTLLNVLCGLKADVGLMGEQKGGWLFSTVFMKPPQQVLHDALQDAIQSIGDPQIERVADLSLEQANLALRRTAMKSQHMSEKPASKSNHGPVPRAGDEFLQAQVWLELLRIHAEASRESSFREPSFQQGVSKSRSPAAQERNEAGIWQDFGVSKQLGKLEADLETESKDMTLEALRHQNRLIEEYVMRLVRQRDELKQIAKLAEERDSYFILGLDGPEATEDEVKRAYRNLARREHPDKAGMGNKRRFQAIQTAYTSVMRQRREGGISTSSSKDDATEACAEGKGSANILIARFAERALQARNAADCVARCAHRTLSGTEDSTEAQSLPRRRALQVLRELTRRGAAELRLAAEHLRELSTALCDAAHIAEDVLKEHRDSSATNVMGVGCRDRAQAVEEAGRTGFSNADLLEKISEATEATLKKVDKASPDASSSPEVTARSVRDSEAANILKLGTRLLSDSLAGPQPLLGAPPMRQSLVP